MASDLMLFFPGFFVSGPASGTLILLPSYTTYVSSIPSVPPTNSLIEPPFFPETLPTPISPEPNRTYPFKIKPSEDPEAKP